MQQLTSLVLLFGACYAMSLVLSDTLPIQQGLVVVVSLAVASTLVVLASASAEPMRPSQARAVARAPKISEPLGHEAALLLKFALAIELTGFLVILLLHLLAVL